MTFAVPFFPSWENWENCPRASTDAQATLADGAMSVQAQSIRSAATFAQVSQSLAAASPNKVAGEVDLQLILVLSDWNGTNNGAFGYGFVRKLREVTDGTSNTRAVGEFVHRDFIGGTYVDPPGNVRPWILGDNRQVGSYVMKVAELPPKEVFDRVADGVPFNHLPMGSFHTGVTMFVLLDGSVDSVEDDVDLAVYQAMATVNGGEVINP